MKTGGIRMLALAGTIAGAGALTGCDSQGTLDERQANIKYIKESGISAKSFDVLEPLINTTNDYTKSVDAGWQKVADSVYWTKKIDSAVVAAKQLGKQAAIDSLETAGKLVK